MDDIIYMNAISGGIERDPDIQEALKETLIFRRH
jgi:hypothetical protein